MNHDFRGAKRAREVPWRWHLAAAIACLMVATLVALTSADKQSEKTPSKRTAATRVHSSELKRIQPNVSNIETVKVAQRKRSESGKKSIGRSAKGKARSKAQTRRLMRSTDEQTGSSSSLQTAGSQANGFAASSDSWNNPHSLVPTFADQEMGDEMVALASDNEPVEQQVKALPQVNGSQLSSSAFMQSFNKDSGDNEKFQREVEQQMSGTAGAKPAAGGPTGEGYYSDEDEEEDEQPTGASTKSAENKRFRGGYNYQQSAGFQLNDLLNRSQTIDRPGDSLEPQRQQPANTRDSWLPTDPIQTEQQQQNSDASESSILRRPQDDAKRIVGMFGGHESVGSSLTKTDIAIEYLKNILKTKQSQQQTSARNSSDLLDNSDRKARNQSMGFYPLPIVMSDYANKKANRSEQAANSLSQASEAMRIQQAPVHSSPSAQHEAKLSIQDVKQQQQQQQKLSLPPTGQAQYTLMPTSFAPSSLASFGVTSGGEFEQERRFTPSPASPTPANQTKKSNPRGSLEMSPANGLLNGTPLGGDYVESLDEYPRPAQQAVAQSPKPKDENQKTVKSQEAKLGSDSLSAAASEQRNSPHYSLLSEPQASQQFHQQQQPSPSFSQAQQQLFEELPPQIGLNHQNQARSSQYFSMSRVAQEHAQILHPLQQQPQLSSQPAFVPIEETKSLPEVPPSSPRGATKVEQVRVESPLSEQPLRSPSQALFEAIGKQQRQRVSEAIRAPSQLPAFTGANRTLANEPLVKKVRVNQLGLEPNDESIQQQPLPPATKTTQISTAFKGPASQIVQQQQIEQQMAEPEFDPSGRVYVRHEEVPEQVQNYRQVSQLPTALRQLVREHEQQMQQFQQQQQQQQQHRPHQDPAKMPLQATQPTQVLHHNQAKQQQARQQHYEEWQHQKQLQHNQGQQKQQHRELQPLYPQAEYREQRHEAPQQQAHHQAQRPHENWAHIEPNYAAPATAPKSIELPPISQHPEQQPLGSFDIQKPPRIVSYNYFESGEPGDESPEAQKATGARATSFQFGDSLLSSNGDVEHLLTQAELEAIQRQFLTAEHPVVPLNEQSAYAPYPQAGSQARQQLINSLKATGADISPDLLSQISSPQGQAEDSLKVLASNNQETRQQPRDSLSAAASEQAASPSATAKSEPELKLKEAKGAGEKKKSLIVYLNHPRGEEMSKAASSSEDNLAQLISEQTSGDPFVSAKEFDSHGLSKDTKHLDVSRLRLEAGKEAQDKDGLSVVVIGDAYKYKKIVLLISSKSGGLKFIPMVKDMKR